METFGRFLWVGLYEPSEQLLSHIQQAFGLRHLAIEDAHNAQQRPKSEVYDDSIFVVIRTARLSDGVIIKGYFALVAASVGVAGSLVHPACEHFMWGEVPRIHREP